MTSEYFLRKALNSSFEVSAFFKSFNMTLLYIIFNATKNTPEEVFSVLLNAWRTVRVSWLSEDRIFCVLSRVDHV